MPYGRDISDTERLALMAQLQELFGEKQAYSDSGYNMDFFGMDSFFSNSQNDNLMNRLRELMGNNIQDNGNTY